MRIALLAGLCAVLAATDSHAQLDLRPPGATQPAARPAAPRAARPVARAPRIAPIPEPRPAEAGDGETAPELASAGTQPTTPPAQAARAPQASPAPPTAQPAAAPAPAAASSDTPSRIDEAFQAASRARNGAPAIPDTHPAVVNAPIPPPRAEEQTSAAPPRPANPPPPIQAEAALNANPQQIEPPFAEAPTRRTEGRAFSDKRFAIGRPAHLPAIRTYAEAHRVPIDLADAVAVVESAYDPHAVGTADEIGLMQIRPSTARQLGFEGTIQDLFEPEANIRLGVMYLAGAWERSGGNLCQALMKYRAGWEETQMSALSIEYCRRALIHLTAIGSPLARGVAMPPAQPALAGPRPASRFNWQDHENRIRQIDNRFGGQNFGIIARERQQP